jgi:hypothetical protein
VLKTEEDIASISGLIGRLSRAYKVAEWLFLPFMPVRADIEI